MIPLSDKLDPTDNRGDADAAAGAPMTHPETDAYIERIKRCALAPVTTLWVVTAIAQCGTNGTRNPSLQVSCLNRATRGARLAGKGWATGCWSNPVSGSPPTESSAKGAPRWTYRPSPVSRCASRPDRVFAGSINGTGVLEVEVSTTAADNSLARIVRIVGADDSGVTPVFDDGGC